MFQEDPFKWFSTGKKKNNTIFDEALISLSTIFHWIAYMSESFLHITEQ